jgi:hypothetical protein
MAHLAIQEADDSGSPVTWGRTCHRRRVQRRAGVLEPLAKADPELRRSVYEAFQLGIELDRNKAEIRLKALDTSAFSTTSDLDDLAGIVANGVIAGAGFEPATFGL